VNRSGLIALADGVREYFRANDVQAVVAPVGWKYRGWQITQAPGGGSRVCFIPGKIDPTAATPPKVLDAGTFEQPRFANGGGPLPNASANPPTGYGRGASGQLVRARRLLEWKKIVTLCVWAVDTTDLSSDEKQIAATENLLELTYQAIHNAIDPVTGGNVGLADVQLENAVWVVPPVEQAYGREIVAYFTHAGPLYDRQVAIATPTAVVQRNPPE
jgi:hypothetical protein